MIAVQTTVMCETPEHVARVAEAMGRTAAGLAPDGLTVTTSIVTVEDDEAES